MLTVTKTRMYTHDKPSPELQAKTNMPWEESWVWKSVFASSEMFEDMIADIKLRVFDVN